jgi:IMP dehydrogenase
VADVEIGLGKAARRAVSLDQLTITPSRRTRDPADVDLSWQLDAYRFELPVLSSATDSVTSPATAVEVGRLGGLGVLDLEGLWTRHEDPAPLLGEIAAMPEDGVTARLQQLYAAPIDPDLLVARIGELRAGGGLAAGCLTPQSVLRWHEVALGAGLDVLVIQGTVVSAEHLSAAEEPLDLTAFIARYDIPVVVGGCASYASALHLMRTGAAGVLVGVGTGSARATRDVLGIGAGQATAIADVAAARSRHLEETGRRVQVIADGGLRTGGDIARAIAVGADAVVLGQPLARAAEAPGRGTHWSRAASHPTVPRGTRTTVGTVGTLAQVLRGPATTGDGSTAIVEALRRSMALCGHASIPELQRAEVGVRTP